jgi:hypothetical protein
VKRAVAGGPRRNDRWRFDRGHWEARAGDAAESNLGRCRFFGGSRSGSTIAVPVDSAKMPVRADSCVTPIRRPPHHLPCAVKAGGENRFRRLRGRGTSCAPLVCWIDNYRLGPTWPSLM